MPVLFESRSLFALSLGVVLLQAAPQCGTPDEPPAPQPYALTYRLELAHTAEGKAVEGLPDAVTFRMAHGHELTHTTQQGPPGQSARVTVRGWTPVRLAAAEVSSSDPFLAWHSRVAALGTCPEGAACDPVAAWAKEGAALSLDGTLTALTDDGEWLFRYHLKDAWPNAVTAGPTSLMELGLASRLGQVEWNPAHPFFGELKAVYEISRGQEGLRVTGGGRDLFAFRAQALDVDGLIDVLDAAFDHPGLRARRVAIRGQRSYANGAFRLELDGKAAGYLSSVSGLSPELETIDAFIGEDPIPLKLVGKTRYPNIVLKRGHTTGELLETYKKILAGLTERRSASIVYLDREGNEVLRYNLHEAWPCQWKAPELNATGDTYAVDALELVAGRIERG